MVTITVTAPVGPTPSGGNGGNENAWSKCGGTIVFGGTPTASILALVATMILMLGVRRK